MAINFTTLLGAISARDTAIQVASQTGITAPLFPSGVGITYLVCESEVMYVTAVTPSNVSVERGVQGTVAAAHSISTAISAGGPADLATMLAPSKAATTFSLSFGAIDVSLPNVKFPQAYAIGLASGDNDLYTVPANRLAFVFDVVFTVPTTASNTFAEVKSGGVYHIFDFINLGNTNLFGATNSVAPFLLHAGETFAINASNTGTSVWPYIVEFDSTAPINDARLFSPSAGANTLFTVPSQTVTFMNFGSGFNFSFRGTVFYFNKSGAARTIQINAVPNGGSASTANALLNGNVSSTQIATPSLYGGLGPGDFINVNTDANTATQTAWVIYTTN